MECVNILLVDDREDGLIAMEAVLQSPEYNLVKARSGAEALDCLSSQDFAVILLDVQMPLMDGFETAAKAKTLPRSKDVPIIFVTAINKDPFYIYQGYTSGAVDYLFKPFDPLILRSKVSVLANLYRQRKQIERQALDLQKKEEELFQARKLEAVGRLAGGVAHDFNNIIAGIMGLSQELLSALKPNDSRRADLDEIIKSSHRAFALTRQLLAFGRRQISSPQSLNLCAVIEDVRKMLRRLIGEDIELNIAYGENVANVLADQSHFEQVLVNLILNARDAMPSGGKINVSVTNTKIHPFRKGTTSLAPGPYVLLEVSDTGCGMSKETLARIYEPFFSTKENDKGTGLGLATVYGIVKQSKGDIAVASQPGKGTTFKIYFPAWHQNMEKRSIQPPASAPLEKGDETILLVEDDDIVRRVVSHVLLKNGYKVVEAKNGSQGIERADQNKTHMDLVITDVVMPGMNGKDMVQQIQKIRPQIAVLYMSGYPENIISTRGVLDPGIDFIQKEEISTQLASKVRHLLDRVKFPSASTTRSVAQNIQ
jgi:two-component system cell cycle sensor histidine kinase/response regulator CckA